MDISQRGIDLIIGSEGKKTLLSDGRYQAYLDKLAKPPVWTIWAGLTHGVHEGMCLTEAECEAMFRKELNIYEHAVETMVTVPLNQNQFDALVSLVYNIGPGSPDDPERKGFYWSTLRKLLNQGKYTAAAAQFARYKYAGGVVYEGLVTRRAKEAALFLEPMPETHEEEPPIPQAVDVGPVVSTTTAIASSPTAKLVGVGLPGLLYAWWQNASDFLFGIVKEAGPQIVETQQSLTPFSPILKMTPAILITITLGTVAAVAIRQIVKRRAGTSV